MKRLPTANGPSTLPAINQRRLMRDLNAIGRIGIGNRGGVTRLVFSIKELRSRQVLIHLMRQAGLKIHIDGIGNIFGRFEGRDAKGPAVLSGSHLDTVIHGGKYDGPVGVIGALEAVRTISENKIPIHSPLEVVCFVGEESSRFGFSTLGSSLVAGEVHPKDLPTPSTPREQSSPMCLQVLASRRKISAASPATRRVSRPISNSTSNKGRSSKPSAKESVWSHLSPRRAGSK